MIAAGRSYSAHFIGRGAPFSSRRCDSESRTLSLVRYPPGLTDARRHRCQVAMCAAASEETVVVIGIDVMHLHNPHQMHRVGGAGKATVGVVDVVADRLGTGEPFGADTDDAGAMLLV